MADIELVIKISEEYLEVIKSISDDQCTADMLIIKNGTPLKTKTGAWIRGEYWSEGIGMGEEYGHYYRCSKCRNRIKGDYDECTEKYCPKCGSHNQKTII